MTSLPKVALAQLNLTVGDITGNGARIEYAYREAKAQGAALVICPELAITGYSPEDLVLTPSFRQAAMAEAKRLAALTADGPALIIGCLWEEQERIYNAALLLDQGHIVHIHYKIALPNYGVFDEKRVFSAGSTPCVIGWRGLKLGLLVCEDMWHAEASACLQQADIIAVINASPFEAGKLAKRHALAAEVAARANAPVIYVNLVGGQDDVVFDGGSFVMSPSGEITHQAAEFSEALLVSPPTQPSPLQREGLNADMEQQRLWNAMMLGLSDYVGKNGFPGVVLGLSGGIDSAISAAIAVDALGPARVKGVLLSSPYTSRESVEDAQESASLLGIETMHVPITPAMGIFEEVLNPVFKRADWMEEPTIGGNLQARLRGVTLMAISNQSGLMLLNTGNKSEIAVGYSTLYGDSCGGYSVLKDVYKTEIFALAHWRNAQDTGLAIPLRSIEKPPSAELKPGQKDEDQLPPYALLDAILKRHIEGRESAQEIIAAGYAPDVVTRVVRMVRLSEYKRRQSCPGVKLSSMQFGKDRRFPLTNKAGD